MSFITVNGDMVRDLWPRCIGRPIDDDTTMDDLAKWQILPNTFDGMCEAIEVTNAGRDSSGANRHRLVYSRRTSDIGEDNTLYEVCLRLQGTVRNSKIGPLGDWNGSLSSCPRAVHRLSINGSLDERVFDIQRSAIEEIKNLIYNSLKSQPFRSRYTTDDVTELVLEHRVFNKVCPTGDVARSVLQRGDDPDGSAKKVEKQWVVDHKIGYALQLEDGSRRSCNYIAIRQGDFIDVGVTFDILTRYTKHKRNTSITLAIQDILRLEKAANVELIKLQVMPKIEQTGPIITASSGLRVDN